MINLSSVSLSYAQEVLLKDLTFTFNALKYGLVGLNGIGKSTLAKLIAGEVLPDKGNISITGNVGYLQQYEAQDLDVETSVYLMNIWEKSNAPYEQIQKILDGVSLNQKLNVLSGGEWVRVRLARLLSESHSFLILDEPSNNLDRPAKVAFKNFIQNYKGGLLLISHDRELLNEMDNTVELTKQGLSLYGGPYDFYKEISLKEREIKLEKTKFQHRRAQKIEKEQHKKIHQQVARTHSGRKKGAREGIDSKMVYGLKVKAEQTLGKIIRKERERLVRAQDTVAILVEELKIDPFFRLRFPEVETHAHKVLIDFENFNWSYQSSLATSDWLWGKDVSFKIKSQDRMRLKGPNGSGKSTLSKIIRGESLRGDGKGKYHVNTTAISYLDQNYSNLKPDLSVLGNLQMYTELSEQEIRNELAFYGFTGDEVFKSASVLSGGEKLKLSLALMILKKQPPELIILDEPTNNLDLYSLELLEKSIRDYKGALLVISHDEEFCRQINLDQEFDLSVLHGPI